MPINYWLFIFIGKLINFGVIYLSKMDEITFWPRFLPVYLIFFTSKFSTVLIYLQCIYVYIFIIIIFSQKGDVHRMPRSDSAKSTLNWGSNLPDTSITTLNVCISYSRRSCLILRHRETYNLPHMVSIRGCYKISIWRRGRHSTAAGSTGWRPGTTTSRWITQVCGSDGRSSDKMSTRRSSSNSFLKVERSMLNLPTRVWKATEPRKRGGATCPKSSFSTNRCKSSSKVCCEYNIIRDTWKCNK